jgi:dihydrofolate reductase
MIYKEAIAWVNKIYLTAIEAEIVGDTFFPVLDVYHWKTISSISHPPDINHVYGYNFITLERCGRQA